MKTTKKKIRKLQLNCETLATLDLGQLADARGGMAARETISNRVTECSIYCSIAGC